MDHQAPPNYSLYFSALEGIIGGRIIQYTLDQPIEDVLTDSRNLTVKPHNVFFAIQGKHHDGHQFINTVYKQGIRQFVVEKGNKEAYKHLEGANIIKVTHCIEALQRLATHHRNKYHLPVLAITGSNGKTIVKEWLSQLLSLKYNVVKSPKSYNSQIGVPLSVFSMNEDHEYGVFEAGISVPNEMAKLEAILKPSAGIFTNIGPAHAQGFRSSVQKVKEKAQLFKNCEKIFYCQDYEVIDQVLQELYEDEVQLVRWSFCKSDADFKIYRKLKLPHETELIIVNRSSTYTFTLPFQAYASIENAIHCIIFLLHEDFTPTMLQQAIAKLRTVPMRLSLKKGINNCLLIDDTYNNDLAGLQVALDFMLQQNHASKRTVILSDLLQTGLKSEKLYHQVAQLLTDKKVDRIIGIGEEITACASAFTTFDANFYSKPETFMEDDNNFRDQLILIKGARKFGLERVADQLQQKIHSTVLEVDLGAITHNLNFFRSKLTKQPKIMVMVKALAYGSSTFEVANLLQHHRVDYLAVAYTDEGVLLRENGITLPIMVMNPTLESFDKLINYRLVPEIYSISLLKAFRNFLSKRNKHAKIHIKLDTGMHRLGIEEGELDALIQVLKETPSIEVESIFSHFAASDEQQHDAYTHHQAKQFMKLASSIEEALAINTTKHVLNSSGILRFPEYQLDMVRLGIGLYGVGVDEEVQKNLAVASTLKTVISQIKAIPQGETIGYGRRGIAKKDMKIATIAIGYADGFSRAFGNGKGKVWINGYQSPVVGNVCMDMTMVDITHIEASEGDEVVVFGEELPLAAVAAMIDTIPYEILTNISERVKKVYFTN